MMAIYCTLVVVLGKALYTHYLSKSQHPCEVDTVTISLLPRGKLRPRESWLPSVAASGRT